MRGFIKSRGLKFLRIFALVAAACAIAVAESGKDPQRPPDSGSPVEKEVLATLEQRMQKRISIDFRDMPIDDVIRIIAEQADVDIVKSPKVIGNVTAKLTDVPLEEALNNILAAHDYGYIADKSMIRIVPAVEITQITERLVNRIYRITYADVIEVEKALKKFISKRGSLSSNLGTSNIIVTDTESKIKAIDTFIDEIDRITPQVLVEVRIYDVTTTEGFDIGTEWHAGRNTDVTTTEYQNTHKRTDSADSGTSTYETTITESDDPEATAPRITETEWTIIPPATGFVTEDIDEIIKTSTSRRSKPFVTGTFDKATGGSIRFGLLNDAVDIDLALTILHTQVSARLLANPRILVLDNETASFKIISEIPYTELSQTSGGGQMTSINFKEVGVELRVTPHITRDGMIRLHILPSFGIVSKPGETTEAGVQTVPTIDTRRVDTKALVRDGQTVVLGGLRKREVSQDISKIPVLGDIPLLGALFSDESESVETNELLIFITPSIVVEPSLSPVELEQLEDTKIPLPKKPTLRISD